MPQPRSSSLNLRPHQAVRPVAAQARLPRLSPVSAVLDRVPSALKRASISNTDSKMSTTTKGRPLLFLKEDKWRDISPKLVRQFKLPHGSCFKVVYDKSKAYPKGRVQRDNTVYKRTPFKVSLMGMPDDDCSLTALVTDFIVPYIDIDLKAMGAKIICYGPDGDALTVRTVGKWRGLPPAPTTAQIEAQNAREAEIDELTRAAAGALESLAEARWDPEDVVPAAVLRALIDEYGLEAVQAQMDAFYKGKRRR